MNLCAKILLKNGELKKVPIKENVKVNYDGKCVVVVIGGDIAAIYNIDYVYSLEVGEEPVTENEDVKAE